MVDELLKWQKLHLNNTDTVQYIGYDLFGLANTALDKKEFNTKRHHTVKEVSDRLNEYAKVKKRN